jgi:hypothetical protein
MPLAAVNAPSDQVAVLLLADIAPVHRLWGWSRIVKGAQGLRGHKQLRFAKVMGSGYEGGFGLRPSASRQGVFAVFNSLDAAQEFVGQSDLVDGYHQRSSECCILTLRTWSCRGSWDADTLALTTKPPETGPVAALTRASIALTKAPAFWHYAPASQASLDHATGCQLAVGLGEAPFLRQATFTIWDSVAAMDAYARSGAHLEAIKAAAQQQFFSESMFARFVPLSMRGSWMGRHYG